MNEEQVNNAEIVAALRRGKGVDKDTFRIDTITPGEPVFFRLGDHLFRTRSISYIERNRDADGTVFEYEIHHDQGIENVGDNEPGFKDLEQLFMFARSGW